MSDPFVVLCILHKQPRGISMVIIADYKDDWFLTIIFSHSIDNYHKHFMHYQKLKGCKMKPKETFERAGF